jgi:hypothetical protein
MKDPCKDNCIIRVVCTQVCNKKINYGILIKNALEQNIIYKTKGERRIQVRTPQYQKYSRLLGDYARDLIEIENRKDPVNKGRC